MLFGRGPARRRLLVGPDFKEARFDPGSGFEVDAGGPQVALPCGPRAQHHGAGNHAPGIERAQHLDPLACVHDPRADPSRATQKEAPGRLDPGGRAPTAVHAGHPPEKIQADAERARWFTAEEAKAYGLVDKVIVKRGEIH